MTKYDIPKRLRRIIRLADTISAPEDPSQLTEDRIQEINNRELPNNWIVRKLLHKPSKDVESRTFIIPVSDGAVTAYFFEKRRDKSSTGLNPLIVFFHGGGWVWGNMSLYNFFCARIADLTNASILAVDYRLAPRYKFPTAVEDCYDTLLWAYQGTRYWKTDPDRVFLMGDSAGGNLAAVVSRLSRDRKGPPIAGQILIYPVTDGRMRTESYVQYGDSPTLTQKKMSFFIHTYMGEPKDILNPSFSPLLAKDNSRLPDTLIISAEYDPLYDDARLYAEALTEADTPVKHLECKKTVHGFLNYPNADGTEETECAIMQFVGGRAVEQIELISRKKFKKQVKRELRQAKKANKHLIVAGVEE